MKTRITPQTMTNGKRAWTVDLNNADYKGDPMFTLRCWFRSKVSANAFAAACEPLETIEYTPEAHKAANGTLSRNLPHIVAGHIF